MSYLDKFDERQRKTIAACREYADDPYGDVAHNLKVIIAQLVDTIETQEAMLQASATLAIPPMGMVLSNPLVVIRDLRVTLSVEITVRTEEMQHWMRDIATQWGDSHYYPANPGHFTFTTETRKNLHGMIKAFCKKFLPDIPVINEDFKFMDGATNDH